MPGYRTGLVRTELTTHYPVGGPETTEEHATVTLLPVDDTTLDVLAEPIAHGRRTRRFAVERVEVRYRRVVRIEHDDFAAYSVYADQVPWECMGVSALGTAVRADGSKGVAAGGYWWSQNPHRTDELPLPEGLASAVAWLHAYYGITTGVA